MYAHFRSRTLFLAFLKHSPLMSLHSLNKSLIRFLINPSFQSHMKHLDNRVSCLCDRRISLWVIWVVLQQAGFFFFWIDSSGLCSNLETNTCTAAKPCIQIQAFVAAFCLYITFLRWCEQLWSLIEWPASCSRRKRQFFTVSASCVKNLSKLLTPKIQASNAAAHLINDPFLPARWL